MSGLKKHHIISFTFLIGITLLTYAILKPKNNVNTFKSNNANITIIHFNDISKPDYVLISGISLTVFSIFILLLDYFNKNKNSIKPVLTKKETEILELLKQGKTNKEIASELFISVSTVKTHINNIFKKLNITNRSEILVKNQRD